MRTDAEKKAFAEKCLEIENAGGDVLGYIEINWPSYTPRATWYNLQMQYLKREKNHLSEGKIEGKEEEGMRRNMKTVYEGAVNALKSGVDPIEYLLGLGYEKPSAAWHNVKAWARKHGYDTEELPKNIKSYRAENRAKTDVPEAAEDDPGDRKDSPENAEEVVVLNGTEYTRAHPEEEHRPVATCCARSTAKGVTMLDELLEVMAIKSAVIGRWQKADLTEPAVHLIWKDSITNAEHNLCLRPAQWQRLAKEIPAALEQLGIT